MWSADGSTLYYLSEQDNNYNIWSRNIATGEQTQLTTHTESVRFPRISRDGTLIAYELGLDLYTLDTDTGETAQLNVVAPSESKFNSVERRTMTNQASEMAISPDESEIAFVVRGELFAMKAKGGEARRLTRYASAGSGVSGCGRAGWRFRGGCSGAAGSR